MGIDENRFWQLTPKTIQVYFRAYERREQLATQKLWLQGQYFRWAIASTISFDKKPADYPEMPFKEEFEKEQANDEEWLKVQRARAWEHFATILSKHKKG